MGEFNNSKPNEILLYKGIAFNSYYLIVSTRFLRLLLSTFEHNGFMLHFITLNPQLTGWNSDAFSYIISINFREIGWNRPLWSKTTVVNRTKKLNSDWPSHLTNRFCLTKKKTLYKVFEDLIQYIFCTKGYEQGRAARTLSSIVIIKLVWLRQFKNT